MHENFNSGNDHKKLITKILAAMLLRQNWVKNEILKTRGQKEKTSKYH